MGEFHCPTQIQIGCAEQVLAQRHPKRMLIVADPFFKDGIAQKLGDATGGEVSYFFEVTPDPSLSLAAKGAATVRELQPELVVALGGGSAMDCAKAMVYFSDCSPELMAIPTTSGSGSEVTDFAILTHDGVKHPLVDSKLRPHTAVLDASLITKLPKPLIADGGFDALSHAVEAYTATGSTCFTDALSLNAFQRIFQQLPHSFQGCQEARKAVHQAATMAGLAFNQSGLGLCHSLSHALGGLLHIPHGRLNAILLPEVISCNATFCGRRYAALARSIGLEGRAETLGVRNLKNALIRLRKDLGLPGTLTEAGIASSVISNFPTLTEAVLADPCCKTNPVPVTPGMVESILVRVTGHG